MSLAMKEAQFAQGDFDGDAVGDPGIFGFVGKVAKKAIGIGIDILPGPVGGIARAGRRALRGGGAPTRVGRRVAPLPTPRRSRPGVGVTIPGFRQRFGGVRGRGTTGRAPSADISFEFGGGGIPLDGGGPDGVTVGTTGQPVPACAVGFHKNKSGYYRRTPAGGVVFIQPESVCVRNRRIDPGNTRATKRAISRIRSAKRLKDALGGVTVHKKPC